MKRLAALILTLNIVLGTVCVNAAGNFNDVPKGHWAEEYVKKSAEYGLLQGIGNGNFGCGKTITRAEFITVLCRMFSFSAKNTASSSFSDVSTDDWFFGYIEAGLENNVFDLAKNFHPNSEITREDMAQMLVRALGLSKVDEITDAAPPFSDISALSEKSKNYISAAYALGMITGTGDGKFCPQNPAKREEAAAMFVRIYEKISEKTDFVHGFYALSSYSQKDVIASTDYITYGWSALETSENGIYLNTTSANQNEWKIPESYELITDYVKNMGKKANLGIYSDASKGIEKILSDESLSKNAVDRIMEELQKNYDTIGENPYSGVTVDFEGLKGKENLENFNRFLNLLSAALKNNGKKLFTAVHPVVYNDTYFDGYDYKTIANISDKVILMAHDYNPVSLKSFIGTKWYLNAAPAPLSKVYYSLKSISDAVGPDSRQKIMLALSLAPLGYEIDSEDNLVSGNGIYPAAETVFKRLNQPGTQKGYSADSRNPYIKYETEDGKRYFLWYENEQSVKEKMRIAKLFGIKSVSLWRIGILPLYNGFNIMPSLN